MVPVRARPKWALGKTRVNVVLRRGSGRLREILVLGVEAIMPVESDPFGCAWSHTLPAGKAGLCSHPQAPGQAPGRPGPSLIPGLVFLHRPLWVRPT